MDNPYRYGFTSIVNPYIPYMKIHTIHVFTTPAKMAEETTIWDEFIDLALIVYHMTKHVIIEVTSFLLMYSREAILFIDESYDFCMKDHMMQIVKKVPHIREEA